MPWTDNPVADFHRHDDEVEGRMAHLPVCEDCGCRITDEHYYKVDCEILCESCMNDRYRKDTDDYE